METADKTQQTSVPVTIINDRDIITVCEPS
jgi:hypothetical protein